jgi:hypothetical protein
VTLTEMCWTAVGVWGCYPGTIVQNGSAGMWKGETPWMTDENGSIILKGM